VRCRTPSCRGTPLDAVPVAAAAVLIDEDDPVLALVDRRARARLDAGGVRTVVADRGGGRSSRSWGTRRHPRPRPSSAPSRRSPWGGAALVAPLVHDRLVVEVPRTTVVLLLREFAGRSGLPSSSQPPPNSSQSRGSRRRASSRRCSSTCTRGPGLGPVGLTRDRTRLAADALVQVHHHRDLMIDALRERHVVAVVGLADRVVGLASVVVGLAGRILGGLAQSSPPSRSETRPNAPRDFEPESGDSNSVADSPSKPASSDAAPLRPSRPRSERRCSRRSDPSSSGRSGGARPCPRGTGRAASASCTSGRAN